MRRSLKLIPWILPLLGIALGYGYAYVFFHGLLETWQFVGKPDENIVRIIGVRDGRKLLVTTETGTIYSFEFYYQGEVALAPQLSWEEEQLDTVDPVSHFEYYGADFISLPPRFQVRQLYDLQYVYRVEGKCEVKFALASDGNLWMWNHQISGLTGLVFFFYPVIGFLVGLAVALLIAGVNWLKRRDRSNSGYALLDLIWWALALLP